MISRERFFEYLEIYNVDGIERISQASDLAEFIQTEPMRYYDGSTASYYEGHLTGVGLCFLQHKWWNTGQIATTNEIIETTLHDSLEDWTPSQRFPQREDLEVHLEREFGNDVYRTIQNLSTGLFPKQPDNITLSKFIGELKLANLKYCDRLVGLYAKPHMIDRARAYIEMADVLQVWPTLVKDFEKALRKLA